MLDRRRRRSHRLSLLAACGLERRRGYRRGYVAVTRRGQDLRAGGGFRQGAAQRPCPRDAASRRMAVRRKPASMVGHGPSLSHRPSFPPVTPPAPLHAPSVRLRGVCERGVPLSPLALPKLPWQCRFREISGVPRRLLAALATGACHRGLLAGVVGAARGACPPKLGLAEVTFRQRRQEQSNRPRSSRTMCPLDCPHPSQEHDSHPSNGRLSQALYFMLYAL